MRGVAADGVAAAGAQNAGDRVRIEKQRQRRAERQRRIGAVGAGGVGPGALPAAASAAAPQQRSCRSRRAAIGMTIIGGERGDVDQDVLDDGDRGRRAQPARIGEGRQDHEGDDQRQVADEARARRRPSPPITTCSPTSCSAM